MAKYITNFSDFDSWLKENGLVYWKVSSTTQAQDNNNKFVYDKNKQYDENLQLCQRALERFAGQMLYATGWRTPDARTGGFSCIVLYNDVPQHTEQQPAYITGVTGAFDKDTLIAEITQKVRNEYDTMNLKREREALDAERKEFDAAKDGVMGMLVHYLAPVAKQMLGIQGSTRVAGVDAAEVAAPAIKVQEEPEQETEETEAEEKEQESPFSDEESDKLYELMQRFAAVEPRYMELLEQVVVLAENKDRAYTMAKAALLG